MGRLIIDGNSFFEIDEDCIKKKRIPKNCGLDKYLNENEWKKEKLFKQQNKTEKNGDG